MLLDGAVKQVWYGGIVFDPLYHKYDELWCGVIYSGHILNTCGHNNTVDFSL